MNYEKIVTDAAVFIKSFNKEHKDRDLHYHRLIHTETVVKAVAEIAGHYRLEARDFFICTMAAWFHDVGYYKGVQDHEKLGAEMAEDFLINRGVDEETTNAIKRCILATKMPQRPSNLLEKIVCDADLYHLGTDDFLRKDKLMRKEAEAISHTTKSKNDWWNSTLLLLQKHHYHTDYCQNLLDKVKKKNIARLLKRVKKNEMIDQPMAALLTLYPKNSYQHSSSLNPPKRLD